MDDLVRRNVINQAIREHILTIDAAQGPELAKTYSETRGGCTGSPDAGATPAGHGDSGMTAHHKLQHDPKALAVARAVHDAIHPETVILFGSRARGDYGPDSDIDLLVITGERGMSNAAYMKAKNAALRHTEIAYGEFMNVDVVRMTPAEYQRCRRGIQPRGRARPPATEL